MVAEQDTGCPVERPRRNLSESTPVPNNETKQIQDTDVQRQQAPQDELQSLSKTRSSSQKSPRRCDPALPSSTPAATALLRNPSSNSTSTPTPEPVVTRRSRWASLYQYFPVEPPVTKSTLSELDVSKIIYHPKLRHDINFDPELRFTPNLDGENGRKKQERADQFWRTLKEELAEFITDRPSFYGKHGWTNDWTLPALLKAVKEIIQTLVPQRDRRFLDEGFNIELLMQQFHKGFADLEKLALWLSQVLKSHCAPMRDDWVDTMHAQLSNGNQDSDPDQLVTGMRSLLSVLEAMKLDVANYQIQRLRPVLIEDTTNFEQKFFLERIQSRKVDISGARQWYREADQRCSSTLSNTTKAFGDMGVFFEALSRLVLPSSGEKQVPSTFIFDEERIVKLRSDMVDAINLDICMRMYVDLERVARGGSKMFGRNNEDTSNASTTPSSELDFDTVLSNSRPSSLVFNTCSSVASSPRSCLVMPLYVAPENSESRTKAKNVYNSLVALLQSAPLTARQFSRWQTMAPSMALQIFRFTHAPSELLSAFEEKLKNNVSRVDSQIYKEVEQAFHRRLMTALAGRVREFKSLSGVSLFAIATGGRVPNNSHLLQCRDFDSSLRHGHDEGGVEEMATRLSHLGVLHWRVWAQLAYLGDIEDMPLDTPGQI